MPVRPSAPLFVVAAVPAFACLAAPVAAQLQPTWSHDTGHVTMSPVRFADVDGDGADDVILATMGPVGDPYSAGSIHVLAADGEPLPGWPLDLPEPITGAAVALGDVDENGDLELVAHGWYNLWVLNHDGTNLPGWPRATGTSATVSPALADLDDDGDLEIVVAHGTAMHVYHHDGLEMAGWPNSAGENFQAPAVADLDGDGDLEILAGTWRAQFPDQVPFQLHAWHADGTPVSGFPVDDLGSIRGPLALGDVDGDGGMNVVVRAGDALHVFDHAGAEAPGWPVAFTDPVRNATPSLGDLDGDGDLEILIGGYQVHALHHDGSTVAGFPAETDATSNINSSAIVASVAGDPDTPEIYIKIKNAIVGLDAAGDALPGFPVPLPDDNQSTTFSPSPVAGDVDGDGDAELAATSLSGELVFFDLDDPFGSADWPTFQHDARNTSTLQPETAGTPADLVDATVAYGTLIAGGLAELLESDDATLRARSRPGFSAFEPNLTDLHVGATVAGSEFSNLEISLEDRINNPGGTGKLRLKNWKSGQFEPVSTYPLAQRDTTRVFSGLSAENRIRNDGRIEVSIKHVLVATLSAIGFDSHHDAIGITAE